MSCTFTVWIIAERIGLLAFSPPSFTISRGAPSRTSAQPRVSYYAVWETVVFMLNVLAFMLIGMQLRPIWTGSTRWYAGNIARWRRACLPPSS